jgi:acetyltransferase-like isoleucine patch superfamily enzyme
MITPGVWFDYLFPELITIEENTIIGEEAGIATHEFLHQEYHVGPVHIGKGCLIGGRAGVLCGVRIGDGATISAMTLVHKHVPPGAFALGVPMKILRGQPERGTSERSQQPPPAEPSPDKVPVSV